MSDSLDRFYVCLILQVSSANSVPTAIKDAAYRTYLIGPPEQEAEELVFLPSVETLDTVTEAIKQKLLFWESLKIEEIPKNAKLCLIIHQLYPAQKGIVIPQEILHRLAQINASLEYRHTYIPLY